MATQWPSLREVGGGGGVRTPDVRSKPKRGIKGIIQTYLYQNGNKLICSVIVVAFNHFG